ncbi:MAG: hypothetical protein CL950_13235 [Erythrobacter sp.]|nr:hypothetical protein A3745_14920 [Erythrobacter sp. HI0074]KZZ08670.1 hypothetical protein A3748_10890 [Erythrobacter sp. HI0077]MAQ30901.1 hypothetical protein [Erythrobacter sp.]
MEIIDFIHDGDLEIGLSTDDDGTDVVCLRFDEADRRRELRLYYRVEHFVAVADHLRSVADRLVHAAATENK